MPDCTYIVRTLMKSTVSIKVGGDSQAHTEDQLMQIDQRTEYFQFDQNQNEEVDTDGAWTTEVRELENMVQRYPNKQWRWDEVASVFKTLTLSGCSITRLDKDVSLLSNVTRFDLSDNKLTEVSALPPQLVGLFMNCNPISPVTFKNTYAPFLRYLDLSYCELSSVPVLKSSSFPSLHALDLSGNDISDIFEIEELSKLPQLSHVCLMMNPIALINGYRERVLELLPNLVQLDEVQKSVSATTVDLPEQDMNNLLVKVSCLSLRGLGDLSTGDNWFGRIDVTIAGITASSPLLPWGRSLIIEPGDTPDPSPVVEDSKVDKKKKGKAVEVSSPPSPVVDRTLPQILDIVLPICVNTRDGLLLDEVTITLKCLKCDIKGDVVETTSFATSSVCVKSFLDKATGYQGIPSSVDKKTEMVLSSGGNSNPSLRVQVQLNPNPSTDEAPQEVAT